MATIREMNPTAAQFLKQSNCTADGKLPLTPAQKCVQRIETASTACESSADSLSSTFLNPSKMMSPLTIPRGRISTGGASGEQSLNTSTNTLSPPSEAQHTAGLDWMVDFCNAVGTPVTIEDGQLHTVYPKLDTSTKMTIVAENDDTDEDENTPAGPAVPKPVSLCQLPKQRGELQPMIQAPVVKKHKEKTYSEENHYGLCEHYASQLDKALEVGFGEINWHCGFNLHHLAAKRNNMELLQFLLAHDVEPLHAIDEFGKKPIDYACPKKRDTVYYMLEDNMRRIAAPDNESEREYQDAKLGIFKVKKEKSSTTGMKNIAESADMDNIAEGVVALKRPDDMISACEAEEQSPAEYKKIVKQLVNGAGWESIQWPRGTSLLHWAARNGKDELCRFLVFEFRCDTRAEDVCGRSSIYYAKLKKHRKLAKKLISSFGFF